MLNEGFPLNCSEEDHNTYVTRPQDGQVINFQQPIKVNCTNFLSDVNMDEEVFIIKVEDADENADLLTTANGNVKIEDEIEYKLKQALTEITTSRESSNQKDVSDLHIEQVKKKKIEDTAQKKQLLEDATIAKPKKYKSGLSTVTQCEDHCYAVIKEETVENETKKFETVENINMEENDDLILIKVEGDDNECPGNSGYVTLKDDTFLIKSDVEIEYLENSDYGEPDVDIESLENSDYGEHSGFTSGPVDFRSTVMDMEDDSDDPTFSCSESAESQNSDLDYSDEKNEAKKKTEKAVSQDKKPRKSKVLHSFTEEDVKDAVQAVLDGRMTRTQAIRGLKISLKTFYRKTQEILGGTLLKSEKRSDYQPFLKAIAAILRRTNATPFKSRGYNLYCAYCRSTRSLVPFGSAEEMREHTHSSHPQTSFKHIVACMLPKKKHEILRLDIADLRCKSCSMELSSWEEMWSHLEAVHSVQLTPAKTKVVPYSLTTNLKDMTCSICSETFPSYVILDSHMNEHFPNYICVHCGKPFVNKARHKAHSRCCTTEKLELYCEHCGKVYTNETSLRYHVRQHDRLICKFCKQRFYSTKKLFEHEKVRMCSKATDAIICHLCPRIFNNQASFDSHLNKYHKGGTGKNSTGKNSQAETMELAETNKYECVACNKEFRTKRSLGIHKRSVHDVQGHVCLKCNSTFKSSDGLRSHNKRMHLGDDVFFQCEHCKYKFGALDYLRKHMRRRHFEQYVKMREAQGTPYVYKPRKKDVQ